MLRRTKDTKDSRAEAIVQLPSKTTFVELVELQPAEREFYQVRSITVILQHRTEP